MDAGAALDARGSSVRRNRVVLAPEAGAKFLRNKFSGTTVATELGSPGRSRISRKPIAQGKPGVLRWTCMLVCALSCASAHGTAGAARTRLSLRPLVFRRVAFDRKARAHRAARRRERVRFIHFRRPCLVERFHNSNPIARPFRACRTRYERRGSG